MLKSILYTVFLAALFTGMGFALTYAHVDSKYQVAVLGLFAVIISFTVRHLESGGVAAKLDAFIEQDHTEHAELKGALAKIKNSIDFSINSNYNLDLFSKQFDEILASYNDIAPEDVKFIMIEQFNKFKEWFMSVHKHGFYTYKGELKEFDLSSLSTQIFYIVDKVRTDATGVLGEEISDYTNQEKECVANVLNDFKAILESKENAKHQRFQKVGLDFVKKACINIIKWNNGRMANAQLRNGQNV